MDDVSRMRVLWVKVGGLWPKNTGGRLRSFHILSELSRRHRVTVITTHGPDEDPDALRRELPWRLTPLYVAVQIAGAWLGALLAHAMFALPLLQVSAHARDGMALGVAEVVATFGLLLTIFGFLRFRPQDTPMAVGLYITAAYWFTASTSFANPAVTVARMFSDTFAGIAPASAPVFIAAQFVGMAAALGLCAWLFTEDRDD